MAKRPDPDYIAACIVHLTGVVLLTAAGWHLAGWWGVAAVHGWILTRRTRKAKP